jgi:hypothetical protein
MDANEFYNTQSVFKPKFPMPPDIDDEELVRWIYTQNIPFIEIDLDFDVSIWQQEAMLCHKYLVDHRENQPHLSWRSCVIHGIDTDKTGIWNSYFDTEPGYSWTSISKLTPTIKKFWEAFPFERLARVRFMQVGPQGYVYPHNDTPPNSDNLLDQIVPINIAIDHPDNCFMTLKGHGVVPWRDGEIKLVNITNDHSVINFSDRPRMHMIGHGYVGNKLNEFTKLIAVSYRKQYERYRI